MDVRSGRFRDVFGYAQVKIIKRDVYTFRYVSPRGPGVRPAPPAPGDTLGATGRGWAAPLGGQQVCRLPLAPGLRGTFQRLCEQTRSLLRPLCELSDVSRFSPQFALL